MVRFSRCIVGLLLIALLFSCNLSKVEEFELGQGFVSTNSGVVLIDTMKIVTSTVRFDSIVTSKLSRILVGGYQNNYTGSVTVIPHFEINSGAFTIPTGTLVYDSLVIRMVKDGYFIGDTTKLITFNVNQISKTLKLNTDGYLYNTSLFPHYNQNIGQARLYPQPHATNKEIFVKLSDNFGNELFSKINNKLDTMQTSAFFKEYFKGVALVSNLNQNQSAVGFTHDSTSVRVYYHRLLNEVDTKVKTFYAFPVDASSTGIWFNQILHNADGSLLQGISQAKYAIPSSSTSDMTMVQPGSGIYTKIRIPGISYLKGYGKNVAFIGSSIRVTPLKDSYSNLNPLPDSLAVYIIDRQNRITSQLSTTAGNIYANKVTPIGFDQLPYYEVNVTPFFTSEIAAGFTENSLLIGSTASKAGKAINPIVFSSSDQKKDIVKMNVYCYIDKQ